MATVLKGYTLTSRNDAADGDPKTGSYQDIVMGVIIANNGGTDLL
ncbi:hypothetical protein [Pedobacter sp. NJ-S-72]